MELSVYSEMEVFYSDNDGGDHGRTVEVRLDIDEKGASKIIVPEVGAEENLLYDGFQDEDIILEFKEALSKFMDSEALELQKTLNDKDAEIKNLKLDIDMWKEKV